jgi:hypothetical protein
MGFDFHAATGLSKIWSIAKDNGHLMSVDKLSKLKVPSVPDVSFDSRSHVRYNERDCIGDSIPTTVATDDIGCYSSGDGISNTICST